MEISELASYLDRTEWSIRMFAYRNNFRKHWTEKDVNFLKENYGKMDIKKLSFELDRDANAIRQKFYRLKKERNEWKR